MIWLYPFFVSLATCQAIIMRRVGMVVRLPLGDLYMSACYSAWGIGWLVTILWWLNRLTYWWLFSLFVVCFPIIYWGYTPKKKSSISEYDLLDRIVEISGKIHKLGNKINGTLKWLNR